MATFFNSTFTQPIMICNTVILPGGQYVGQYKSVNSVHHMYTSMKENVFQSVCRDIMICFQIWSFLMWCFNLFYLFYFCYLMSFFLFVCLHFLLLLSIHHFVLNYLPITNIVKYGRLE